MRAGVEIIVGYDKYESRRRFLTCFPLGVGKMLFVVSFSVKCINEIALVFAVTSELAFRKILDSELQGLR
jgi:hypothetical protein